MSSWLNFNESLSSLKGQISTFANNVLAEESEGSEITKTDYDELKKLCVERELQIQNLKRIIEEHAISSHNNTNNHEENGDTSWDWDTKKSNHVDQNLEEISTLKENLKELKNEKNDLIAQLEQLDSENQQNISELVLIRDKLQDENNELKEKCLNLKQQKKTLHTNEDKYKKRIDELVLKIEELEKNVPVENTSEDFKEKYDSLIKEHNKLNATLEETEKELSVLKSTNTTLQKIFEDSKAASEEELQNVQEKLRGIEGESKIMYGELQKANKTIQEFELKSIEDNDNCKKLAFILESYEKQVSSLQKELEEARALTASKEYDGAKEEQKLEIVKCEKEDLHEKYVRILTENVKKCVDCDSPSDFQCGVPEDPHTLEFGKQVENIMKILLDFKYKCETLERELYDLTEEKTRILQEKNNEIEKLLQNSEILSQEVISKSDTIKEYESECNELMKNNEIILSELDSFRNNSSLQTISETNEDNMLLLESQLETANMKIENLENIIKRNKQPEEEKENDNIEDQTERSVLTNDVENCKKDYQDLLNKYDELQIECDTLRNDLDNTKAVLDVTNDGNEQIKACLEKLRTEFENTEYQLTETNVNMDGLKEELQRHENKVAVLLQENKELRKVNSEITRNSENIREELNDIKVKLMKEKDLRRNMEVQIKTYTEKLQNSKMAETSLKLQYDTLQKEVYALSEAKYSMDILLNEANDKEKIYQENLLEKDSLCEELKKSIECLNQTMLDKYNQISLLENQIENLEEKVKSYANIHLKDVELQTEGELGNTEITNSELNENLTQKITCVEQERDQLQEELKSQQIQATNYLEQNEMLRQQLQELTTSRNELITIVTTKHQESLTYHNEIQRLSQILKAETEKCAYLEQKNTELENTQSKLDELEKLTDQNKFLQEKCEILANNLLEEQAKSRQLLTQMSEPSEKEQALAKKLERLQSHMIEVEDHYTQELLQAEQRNAELQAKVNEIEQREKTSSTMYTSVSIRANQQVEVLQNQLQLVTNQRDELRKKISDAEDMISKQTAALSNLQFVLEQFQKDKEKDVVKETERIRRQISVEKQVQEDLKKEITALKSQLQDSKQGLQAAARLSDQLELSKKQNQSLKEEMTQLLEKLLKHEHELKALTSQTDGKVDRSLIKNLIIGFLSSNSINMNKDQIQILKIIATVLDFNQQDHEKVRFNKPPQGSWLSSLLAPQSGSQNISQESLSQAFVRFLENESKPRVVPSLLTNTQSNKSNDNSEKTTPRQSPIVLSEIVLPTFADFAQNRNSSSILKDVLKDNS